MTRSTSPALLLIWIALLCLFSGALNIFTLLRFAYSVSHFSGNLLDIADDILLKHALEQGWRILLLIGFFALGAFISGLLMREGRGGYRPLYGYLMLGMGVVLWFWSRYGHEQASFLYALTMTMGCQNALYIQYRSNVVRTTHMTGNLTDFGVNLGYLASGQKDVGWKVWFSLMEMAGYFAGGALAVVLYLRVGQSSFEWFSLAYAGGGLFYLLIGRQADGVHGPA
ncbi:YoaK family protein [Craterilacuibacter sp. RT1T]|uniref:YoaK family protein n=1 Tax=Craterilacuibacter sp. RT1T TaxID=2942211 RepID=UPI0020C0DCE6|nr:YoaK family protein [Craterilacuibacter sp. RT1T]MCL6262194.1 DUF1275 domain-containing protein [Craterilacuibacter sp. RT1T]